MLHRLLCGALPRGRDGAAWLTPQGMLTDRHGLDDMVSWTFQRSCRWQLTASRSLCSAKMFGSIFSTFTPVWVHGPRGDGCSEGPEQVISADSG
jgi:hypothetical protein